MISVVIPHLGRDDLLYWHLRELRNQVYTDFETIVVIDDSWERSGSLGERILIDYPGERIKIGYSGGHGPGMARNIGAGLASGDIVLFLGSDCIPDPNLIAEHYYSHEFEQADIVQGYTPFHPEVITPFYDFIDKSGLQAAWNNLRDSDGKFRRFISPVFCLTTNYSINRRLFLNEKFNPVFTGAAWEDIELGYRLSKYNSALRTVFNQNAINYHYHRYNLESFAQRSNMEGYHRLTICKIHPEMGWGMVNPFDLRVVRTMNESQLLVWAHELDAVSSIKGEDIDVLLERKYQRYGEVCKAFSLKGVLERIQHEHPAMQALEHVHSNEQVIEILSGVNALDTGHIAYAMHTAQWFISERPDDWSAWAYLGEIELEARNRHQAIQAFTRSVSLNPNAEWAKKRYEELV